MSNYAPLHDAHPDLEKVTFGDYPRVEMILHDSQVMLSQLVSANGETKYGTTVSGPPIIRDGELSATDLESEGITVKGYIDIDYSQFEPSDESPWEDILLNAVNNDLVPSNGRNFVAPNDWAVYIPIEECAHYVRVSVQSNVVTGSITLETIPYHIAHQAVDEGQDFHWDKSSDDTTKAALFVETSQIWAQIHGIIVEELSDNKTEVKVSLSPSYSNTDYDSLVIEQAHEPSQENTNRRDFSEIGGNFVAKDRLGLLVDTFKNPELAKQYNITNQPILLYGPPGTGKDTMVEILADQVGGTLRTVSSSEIVEKWVGNSARNLEEVFDDAIERASEESPVVLFFNEFEALATKGENLTTSERIDLLNIFSQRIDKLAANPVPIILVAATNADIQDLEPKLTRPGRFEPIKIGLPSTDLELNDVWTAILTRENAFYMESFDDFTTGEPASSTYARDLDVPSLVQHSEGMSGATIVEALRIARLSCFRQALAGNEVVPISTEAIKQALQQIRMR